MVEQLLSIYRRLGLRHAHLYTLSFGTLISHAFVQAFPEKVLSLCHVGGYCLGPSPLRRIYEELWEKRWLPYPQWVKLYSERVNPDEPDRPNPFAEESRQIFYRYGLSLHPNLLRKAVALQLAFDNTPIVRTLSHPTLWLMGEYDHVYRATLGVAVLHNPNIRLHVVPNSPHVAHKKQPDFFAQTYAAFLHHAVPLHPSIPPSSAAQTAGE